MNASELHKLLKPYRESSHGTSAEVEGTLLHGKVKARDTSGLTEEQSGLVQKCWDFMAELEASGLKVAEQEKNVYIEELGIGGEIDAFMTGDNSCAVIDWKFGKAKTVPPAMNPQLMAYAYCALTETGCDNCTAYIFNPRRGDCVSYTFYNPQELLENIRQMNTGKWEKGKTKKQDPVFPLGTVFNPIWIEERDAKKPLYGVYEGVTFLSCKHPTAEFVDQETGAKIMLKLTNGEAINKIDYTDLKIMYAIEALRCGQSFWKNLDLDGCEEYREENFAVSIETIAKMLDNSIEDTRERVYRFCRSNPDSIGIPSIEYKILINNKIKELCLSPILSSSFCEKNGTIHGIIFTKNTRPPACKIAEILWMTAHSRYEKAKAIIEDSMTRMAIMFSKMQPQH